MAFLENHPNVISTTKIRTPDKKDRNQTETTYSRKEVCWGKSGEPGIRSDGFKSSNSAALKLVCTVLSLSDSQTTTTHSLSKGDPYSLLHTAPSGRWVTERGTGGSRLNTTSCQKTTTPADGHTVPYVMLPAGPST